MTVRVKCRLTYTGCRLNSIAAEERKESTMRTDIDIKRDVEAELRINPDIDATDIAVAVKNAVVTLSGFVSVRHQRL